MGRKPETDRNNQIVYEATVEMMTVREIAEKHSISESRVYQILKDQSQQHLPEDIHKAMHALGLRTIKKTALEIMEKPSIPTFDVKGNPLIDPATGMPVYDDGMKIKAMDQYIRADREERILYARDSPKQERIIIEQQRSEMQLAVQKMAELVRNNPDMIREAFTPKAIEGHVEEH
jgi:predicted DNA-binding transcriptional regulator AlpA